MGLTSSLPQRLNVRAVLLLASAVLLLCYAVVVVAALANSPAMISSVEARTEQVSFTVSNADFVALDLAGFRLGSAPAARSSCLTGSFSPAQGANVTYQIADEGFAIQVEAPNGRPAGIAEAVPDVLPSRILLLLDRSLCKGPHHRRFAIGGPAIVGSDYRSGESPVLLSGKIALSARSATGLFARRRDVASLYPAGGFDLPAGSQLRECVPPGASAANWWGFVDAAPGAVDGSDGTVAMSAHLVTDAQRLALSTPAGTGGGVGTGCAGGAGGGSDRESVIALSLLAQIAGDPRLAQATLVVTFLIIVLQLAGQIASLPGRKGVE